MTGSEPSKFMTITFIGYRGSGKTAVGRAVAGRLGRPFFDADAEIERRAGRTVRDVFGAEGEAGFRRIERQTLAELLAGDDAVVSAGGGAVLLAENRDAMRRAGPVVWLRVTADTAEQRIAGDPTTALRRPALTTLPAREEIESLIAARGPLYAETASVVLDADDATVEELAERTLAALTAAARKAGA